MEEIFDTLGSMLNTKQVCNLFLRIEQYRKNKFLYWQNKFFGKQ